MFQKKPCLEQAQILEPHLSTPVTKVFTLYCFSFFKRNSFQSKTSLEGPEWQLGVVHCRVFGSWLCSVEAQQAADAASTLLQDVSCLQGEVWPLPEKHTCLWIVLSCSSYCPRPLLPYTFHIHPEFDEWDVSPKQLCNLRWFGKGKHTLYFKALSALWEFYNKVWMSESIHAVTLTMVHESTYCIDITSHWLTDQLRWSHEPTQFCIYFWVHYLCVSGSVLKSTEMKSHSPCSPGANS